MFGCLRHKSPGITHLFEPGIGLLILLIDHRAGRFYIIHVATFNHEASDSTILKIKQPKLFLLLSLLLLYYHYYYIIIIIIIIIIIANYKTIILPVVLYGCETWSLALREEHRLRVFENKVLRKIFGPKRDEITGE